jgi:hypothetical protein
VVYSFVISIDCCFCVPMVSSRVVCKYLKILQLFDELKL